MCLFSTDEETEQRQREHATSLELCQDMMMPFGGAMGGGLFGGRDPFKEFAMDPFSRGPGFGGGGAVAKQGSSSIQFNSSWAETGRFGTTTKRHVFSPFPNPPPFIRGSHKHRAWPGA